MPAISHQEFNGLQVRYFVNYAYCASVITVMDNKHQALLSIHQSCFGKYYLSTKCNQSTNGFATTSYRRSTRHKCLAKLLEITKHSLSTTMALETFKRGCKYYIKGIGE